MAHPVTLQDWFKRLAPGETPVFRHTRDSLLALRRRADELTTRELTAVVLADPLATLRVIFAANNRHNRHFGSDVATVEHALMMQGLVPYLNKAPQLVAIEDTPAGKDPEILASLYRLLRIAQHAAWQARDFAVLHMDVRAEEVQVAALLYYAPEFLFWLQAPDIARRLARLRRRLPSEEAEKKVLGFELAPLRLAMLHAWRIPELTLELLQKDIERSRQIILQACFKIAHHSRHGWWDEHLASAYESLAKIENTDLDTIILTAHQNAIHVARAGDWIPATPAATWLPLLPGPWPEEAVDDEAEPAEEAAQPAPAVPAEPAQPSPAAQAAPAKPAAATAPEPAKAGTAPTPGPHGPDKAILKQEQLAIEQHLDGSLTLPQMSAHILRGLHAGLGLTRLIFAMVTPDGRRVKSRFTLGIPQDHPLRHFEFELGGNDLFGQLMTRMQGVWLNPGNRAQLWPRISPAMRQRLGPGDFFAMSLFVGNRPFGLIYGDHGEGDLRLDLQSYSEFKLFCLTAARGLAKLKA